MMRNRHFCQAIAIGQVCTRTATREHEIVVRVIKGKPRNGFSVEETALTGSGGQSFNRRLFAGYHAYVAVVCLVSLPAQPLLFGALALLQESIPGSFPAPVMGEVMQAAEPQHENP